MLIAGPNSTFFFFLRMKYFLAEPSRVEWSQAVTNNDATTSGCWREYLATLHARPVRWQPRRGCGIYNSPAGQTVWLLASTETWKYKIPVPKSRRIHCNVFFAGGGFWNCKDFIIRNVQDRSCYSFQYCLANKRISPSKRGCDESGGGLVMYIVQPTIKFRKRSKLEN